MKLKKGTYKHFKGNLYELEGVAKHSETMEDMVIYKRLENNSLWVRPATMWGEKVEREGKKVQRFKLVESKDGFRKAVQAIKDFTPLCEQEEVDKALFLEILSTNKNCLTRESLIGHFTVSAWVMNPAKTKVLCAFHNLYQRWAWLGGHCDGDDDFLAVIKKEIAEESGVEKLQPYGDGIFSLESLSVLSHFKKGKYVPAHCHWNVTYAFIADEDCYMRIKEDENSEVGWKEFDELVQLSPKQSTSSHGIYQKIIDKVRKIEGGKK